MKVDAVSLEILLSRLTALMDEAAASLTQASFSTVVRDAHDYALILMSPKGEVIAENSYGLVAFVTTMPAVMKNLLKQFPAESWSPDDAVITNDPWLGVGHVLDLAMATPIFYKNSLVAFQGSIVHVPDIGGVVWSADSRDVFEEGILIPPLKAFRQGQPDETLFRLLEANNRLPDQFMGDLYARLAAAETCRTGLLEILEDEGIDDLAQACSAMFELSEATMRRAISACEDGVYRAQVEMDGVNSPLTIAVTIQIGGSEISVDFSGTSAQVPAAINVCPIETQALAMYPLKCALDPESPRTEGSYRPISVTAPKGTLLNPTFPAAMNARQITSHYVNAAIFKALAPVIPDRVIAHSGSPHMQVVFSGETEQGAPFTALIFDHPGMGARPTQDGLTATHFPGNVATNSVEIIEATTPLQIVRRDIAGDSGGPGRYRGGCGLDIAIQVATDTPVVASVLGDRITHPAEGLFGGLAGAPAAISVNGVPAPTKSRMIVHPGDVVEYREAGGGGYGPPTERSREMLLSDLRNSYVSPESAVRYYALSEDDVQGIIQVQGRGE